MLLRRVPPARAVGAFFLLAALLSAILPAGTVGAVESPARRIVVNLPSRTLSLYEGEVLLKRYPAAVGNPLTPTPLGSYRVSVKVVNPTWYPKGRKPVPPGPANPIGSRWIGLDTPGIGIHGTNAPASIGQAASGGCLRLANTAVEELFPLIQVGTPVELTYETVEIAGLSSGETDERALLTTPRLTVYPDLYRRGAPGVPEVAERLAAAGVTAELDTAELGRRLAEAQGVPLPVPVVPRVSVAGRPGREARWLEDRLWLRVSEAAELVGEPLLAWEGELRRVDGDDWLSAADLARRTGYRLQAVPARATLYLTTPLIFWQGTPVARAWSEPGGEALVPVRRVAAAVGHPVAVDDCLLVAVGEGGRAAEVVKRGEEAYLTARRAAGLLGLKVYVAEDGFWFEPPDEAVEPASVKPERD